MQDHYDSTWHLAREGWADVTGLLFILAGHLFFAIVTGPTLVGRPPLVHVWPSTPEWLLWGTAVYAVIASAIMVRHSVHIATWISFTPSGFLTTRFGIWHRQTKAENVIALKEVVKKRGYEQTIVKLRGDWLDIRSRWYEDYPELIERFSSMASHAIPEPPSVSPEDEE